jgi:hypothetical protein
VNDQARRKELRSHYEQARPEAAVYRIVNRANKRETMDPALLY